MFGTVGKCDYDYIKINICSSKWMPNSFVDEDWSSGLPLQDIAQSVEHHTGFMEVMGLNPVGPSEIFLGCICNCLSYFTTAKISFTSVLY